MVGLSCTEQLQNPNLSLYNEDLWEVAKGQCSYLRTGEAVIVQRLACSISAISDILIICIIFVSPTKLSSVYHRIILGMCITDIIMVVSFAFTTLPMPSAGDYWTDSYNIQGTRMGNTLTCTAQGFFIAFGTVSSCAYYFLSLNLYYLCSIGFKMRIETMIKYIEPMIHSIPISAGLLFALPPLFQGQYNASNDRQWCDAGPKPCFCDKGENGTECVRGESSSSIIVTNGHSDVSFYKLCSTMVIIQCLCLGIICWRVYQEEAYVSSALIEQNDSTATTRDDDEQEVTRGLVKLFTYSYSSSSYSSESTSFLIPLRRSGTKLGLQGADLPPYQIGDDDLMTIDKVVNIAKEQYKETKIITEQSIMYVLAALIIQYSSKVSFSLAKNGEIRMLYMSAMFALSNLGGFFNLLIFTYHKVYNMKRCNSDLSISEAIIKLFRNGEGHDSFVLTKMDMILRHDCSRANQNDEFHDDISKRREDTTISQTRQPLKSRAALPLCNWADLKSKLTNSDEMITNINYGTTSPSSIVATNASGSAKSPSRLLSSSSEKSIVGSLNNSSMSYTSKEDDNDISFSSTLSHRLLHDNYQRSSIAASVMEENFDNDLESLYKGYGEDYEGKK
jgi:hypothetical protein